MKKWILLSVMLGAVTLPGLAQDDDMYFVPSKNSVARERASASYSSPAAPVYHSGSWRSIDDYNRRGSSYEVLPSDSSDIINFLGVEGVYPDSLSDFELSRKMSRFDGYEPYEAYMAGYAKGYSDWSWHSPWYYSSFYPWYDSWYYDPWYYGYGWYDPWYYSYWGWGGYYSRYYYHPWYYGRGWGGGGYVAHTYSPGTHNHGRVSGAAPNRGHSVGRSRSYSAGTFGSNRSGAISGARSTGQYGGSRSAGTSTRTRTVLSGGSSSGTYSNSNGNFGGSSSSSSGSFGGSRSSGGGSYSSGGGGGGGSYSSGGGGGSRSGGGGGFGSRRR